MTEGNRTISSAAPLNLIKLSVGTESPEHLARVQRRRLQDPARGGRLFHVTRNTPRRASELLDGGSIYWVIRGRIRVRQRLLGIETDTDGESRRICRLVLDPRLVSVEAWRCRAFQGWRYLTPQNAPPDAIDYQTEAALPGGLAEELRELGLL